ncbi:MAG: flagellar basal body rod protein FlgB [Campylobacteraceae bacterium]|nr:flagellar basal body rod protein FlgB [Campylobacteraceae bacterium]
MITTHQSKPLLEQALAARSLRQQLVSSNIANIDTPYYKSKDVDFETVLTQKAKEIYGEKNLKPLRMANTHQGHLEGVDFKESGRGTIYLRDGHMARNDGNTVDLDVETTEMSKNAIMIDVLTQTMKRQSAIFRSVIEASGKI